MRRCRREYADERRREFSLSDSDGRRATDAADVGGRRAARHTISFFRLLAPLAPAAALSSARRETVDVTLRLRSRRFHIADKSHAVSAAAAWAGARAAGY